MNPRHFWKMIFRGQRPIFNFIFNLLLTFASNIYAFLLGKEEVLLTTFISISLP